MEYIYAALLLYKLGKPINEANVKKVLEAAGAKIEDAKVKALVSALDGVDIEKELKEAQAMPAVQPQEQKVEKKEEKSAEEEKKSEEQAAIGLGALFS